MNSYQASSGRSTNCGLRRAPPDTVRSRELFVRLTKRFKQVMGKSFKVEFSEVRFFIDSYEKYALLVSTQSRYSNRLEQFEGQPHCARGAPPFSALRSACAGTPRGSRKGRPGTLR